MEVFMTTNQAQRELLRKKRLEEKRRKNLTVIIITIGAILLISLAAILPNLLKGRATLSGGEGFTLGNPDAPITVVNFSSFACGWCENFAKTTEPNFIRDYVETGHVFYRYLTLAGQDEASQNLAKAAYCAAEQNRFFEYKPDLYTAASVQGGASINNLIRLADSAGLEIDSFETCLLGDNGFQNALEQDRRFAQSVGVTGTPSFLVNDQLVSASELTALLDELLDK